MRVEKLKNSAQLQGLGWKNFLNVRESATSYRAIQLPTEDNKLLSVEKVRNLSGGKMSVKVAAA